MNLFSSIFEFPKQISTDKGLIQLKNNSVSCDDSGIFIMTCKLCQKFQLYFTKQGFYNDRQKTEKSYHDKRLQLTENDSRTSTVKTGCNHLNHLINSHNISLPSDKLSEYYTTEIIEKVADVKILEQKFEYWSKLLKPDLHPRLFKNCCKLEKYFTVYAAMIILFCVL